MLVIFSLLLLSGCQFAIFVSRSGRHGWVFSLLIGAIMIR